MSYWNWRFCFHANAFRRWKKKRTCLWCTGDIFQLQMMTLQQTADQTNTHTHAPIRIFSYIHFVKQFRSTDTFSKLFNLKKIHFFSFFVNFFFWLFLSICDKSMIEIFKAPKNTNKNHYEQPHMNLSHILLSLCLF